MAKKNKNTQEVSTTVSGFNGRLRNLIGCGIVMLLVFGIMAGIGVGVVYGLTQFKIDFKNPVHIAAIVVAAICVLIGLAWAGIKFMKWEAKHFVISNNEFKFDANAFQLLGTCIKWLFLTVITVGIYGLWLPIKVRNWKAKHTTATAVVNENAGYPQPQVSFYTYPQN
ncbi:MAG: DUF898 domain-containing protein [Clostridiales bacterium]|nr:DUF898 domain-containing protein [Clostridiales bacterium]